jgi:hypothetical protein
MTNDQGPMTKKQATRRPGIVTIPKRLRPQDSHFKQRFPVRLPPGRYFRFAQTSIILRQIQVRPSFLGHWALVIWASGLAPSP